MARNTDETQIGARREISATLLVRCVQVALRLRVTNTDIKMVPTGRYVEDSGDDQEERILAMLGIIGTVLNLLVVIFVYIYTTI
ncbi:hypothetical protein MATL_G00116720 [Megalops atlanticus]|uniref:Uncharacterized protein n=1 Tax=Megalops atlanticus TaxID=7932 RepID=A0A9D3PXW0_MEGAT|nr:hypothetical protein MATL_G00116720 [Megalops atlanticus]